MRNINNKDIGVILIYSCQKYKDLRIKSLSYLKTSYSGWKVFFIIGNPILETEYVIDSNIIYLKCEDSYLHLLKKTILGFKVALQIVPNACGILKCGDDILFNETELERFIQYEKKYDYMGNVQGSYIIPNGKHKDNWIIDYYNKHPEDIENREHGLPSMNVIKTLNEIPTIQAISGPLTYFSKQSCKILVNHMEQIEWNILKHSDKFGYIYIIEEPGISYILHAHQIHPTHYLLFTESNDEFKTGRFLGLHTNSYKWMSPKRLCIIGAGWYGCHAARYLKSKGVYVHILDKEGIFSGASAKNQNRLHLGYHYPRSIQTIEECQKGYDKFIREYGYSVIAFDKNYYLLHEKSYTSLEDYKRLFAPLKHIEHDISTLNMIIKNVQPTIFQVHEKLIDNNVVKETMKLELNDIVEIVNRTDIRFTKNNIYVNDIEYDYVLNCTNNQYVPIPIPYEHVYENVCTLLYKIKFAETTGLTIMDGPFFSIYPYDIGNSIYTVTHVVHSVLSRSNNLTDISNFSDTTIREKIECDLFQIFPSSQNLFEYKGFFISKKTKYDFKTDDRSMRWFSKGNYYSFSGGKITGIFEMEPILDSLTS
jgi:hypothetical protein